MNLETLHNTKIVLLGKSRALSHEEFEAQLRVHSIELLPLERIEEVKVVVEGSMMNPYEQNLVDTLYEKGGVEFVNIEILERLLAQKINPKTLLMSLKLSKNKQRLLTFLKNSHITDELFFELLKMYDFGGEDFFENDTNRDVTAALIVRFYNNIERNHNVQYATTGLLHLIHQTNSCELLEVVSGLTPMCYHPELLEAIALHPMTPKNVLQTLARKADLQLKKALACNTQLDKQTALKLLQDNSVAPYIAQNISLDEELFEALQPWCVELATNATLTPKMQEILLNSGDDEVVSLLACHPNLAPNVQERLLEIGTEVVMHNFARYTQEASLLAQLMKEPKYASSLACNSNTPQEFLEKLYETGCDEVLVALAKNENTPVALLYQLQLDRRYERLVKTNKTFGKHIQSENIGWLL